MVTFKVHSFWIYTCFQQLFKLPINFLKRPLLKTSKNSGFFCLIVVCLMYIIAIQRNDRILRCINKLHVIAGENICCTYETYTEDDVLIDSLWVLSILNCNGYSLTFGHNSHINCSKLMRTKHIRSCELRRNIYCTQDRFQKYSNHLCSYPSKSKFFNTGDYSIFRSFKSIICVLLERQYNIRALLNFPMVLH
jgi:hypothetical protein